MNTTKYSRFNKIYLNEKHLLADLMNKKRLNQKIQPSKLYNRIDA